TRKPEPMNASVTRGAGAEGNSLQVLWEDADRAFYRLWHGSPGSNRHAFIPVPGSSGEPTLQSIDRLTHEHELKELLDAGWALRPMELVREHGRTMLVVEYSGGEPLDHLSVQPLETGLFLRLAIALSGAIGRVHGRGLVHKDIKPANVIVDSTSGQVWLTGFGVASRLPRERPSPEPPE